MAWLVEHVSDFVQTDYFTVTPSNLATIPTELVNRPQWLNWHWERREGRVTKVPYIPSTERLASSTDPETWSNFQDVCQDTYDRGVGYVFARDDPYTGVDLDHCRDPETGFVAEWAQEIVTNLDSYAEYSPSGEGIHVIVRAKLPPGRRQATFGGFYDVGRYFTMTGQHVPGTPLEIRERQPHIDALMVKLLPDSEQGLERKPAPRYTSLLSDTELVERAKNARNGLKFSALWEGNAANYDDDESRADMALVTRLAFWCRNDAAQMDRLFRQSGLYRGKWDSRRGSSTYGGITIDKAISMTREVYRLPAAPSLNGHAPDMPIAPAEAESFHLTEQGNAERLVKLYGVDIHYSYVWNKWSNFDTIRWRVDITGQVVRHAKETIRSILKEASEEEDDVTRKALVNHARKSETARMIASMLTLAQSEPGISVHPNDFDRDPYLLNLTNGTFELRTNQLRPHDRADMITKLAPVAYNALAMAPAWQQFLERVVPDVDVRQFLQRAAGYSITGDVSEQCLFFLYGSGANGKSTFLNVLLDVLGDYANQAAPGLLIAKKVEGHPTDTAKLFGSRLVVTTEVEQGKQLAESLTKHLTGGDIISTRRMHEDFWDFKPTHHLWIAGNYKPKITGTDEAIWRRLYIIPFTETIPESERDLKLTDKLRAEAPGILRWLIDGCTTWQRDGLMAPPAVRAATKEYRSEQDVLATFIGDSCVEATHYKVAKGEFYRKFQMWCDDNGEKDAKAQTQRDVSRGMVARGYIDTFLTGGKRSWKGLQFRPTGEVQTELSNE